MHEIPGMHGISGTYGIPGTHDVPGMAARLKLRRFKNEMPALRRG